MLPQGLIELWSGAPGWIDELPVRVGTCARRWGLELEQPFDTPHSLVIPAGDVVLKLNAPQHVEAKNEAHALIAWDGDGAVRLLEHDESIGALLIERCTPGTQLNASHVDKCSVAPELLSMLLIAAADEHPFSLLSDEADRWSEQLALRFAASPLFDQILLERALTTCASVDRDSSWLVNQDLHAGNILAARREPWLVIDPKPLVGERELSAVGLLRNAAWEGGPVAVRRWLDCLSDLGLDRDRLRDWGITHALAWGWTDPEGWSPASVQAAIDIAAS